MRNSRESEISDSEWYSKDYQALTAKLEAAMRDLAAGQAETERLIQENGKLYGEVVGLKSELAKPIGEILALLEPSEALRTIEKLVRLTSLKDLACLAFDSLQHARLGSLDIVPDYTVRTAMAITARQAPHGTELRISPYFGTFALGFGINLLVHEMLHILEAELPTWDIGLFYREVAAWYDSPDSGVPEPSGNYVKYTLKHYLYDDATRAPEHNGRIPGVEEFAFIGALLALEPSYYGAVSEKIANTYEGILVRPGERG